MAIRKFIFFNTTEGYSQEQAATDELSLGKVTLSGVSGVALDVGGADIANLGAPVGANSAARKAYVDSGLATEAAARAADVATVNAAITAEANTRASADTTLQSNITAEATARAAADTTLGNNLNTEATTRAAADAALQAEIDAEETARANAISGLTTDLADEETARIAADTALQADIDAEEAARIAAVTSLGVSISNEANARASADTALQGDIDAEEAARIAADTTLTNNLSTETAARIAADSQLAANYAAADSALSASLTSAFQAADAAVVANMQAYADSLVSGFHVKAPVKAIATSNITLSGTQSVDGVSLTAGMRVLVAGQTAAENNGIYVVAAGAWARATDADSSSEVKDGMSVFVEQGTVYGDSTWVLITNNDITLNTTALTFVQFSGLGQITAGDGLSKSGNELSVNVGNGIELVADAVAAKVQSAFGLSVDGDGVRVDLASGKGLEFSGGDIAVKLESDAGMEFDGVNGGLELKLDGATLSKSASGVKVAGLPSLFTIAGSATQASVTNVALNTLTAGNGNAYAAHNGTGTGDAYHNHQTLVGGDLWAHQSISADNGPVALYIVSSGKAAPASCSSSATARVVGLTVSSPNINQQVPYVSAGWLTGFSGLTAGEPYYLGSAGLAVPYSSLGSGDRVVRLGYAVTASSMRVAIQDLGQKA